MLIDSELAIQFAMTAGKVSGKMEKITRYINDNFPCNHSRMVEECVKNLMVDIEQLDETASNHLRDIEIYDEFYKEASASDSQ